MDVEALRKTLQERERELLESISRFEQNARESVTAEVEDPIDRVISASAKAGSFKEASLEHETLADVRQALERLDEGTYGMCIDCGRPIEPARLQAVPWAAYCLADQEKHERARGEAVPLEGLESAE